MIELLLGNADIRPHQEGTSPAITLRSTLTSTAVVTLNHTLAESNFQYKRLDLRTGAATNSNNNTAGNRIQVVKLTLPVGYEFEIANQVRYTVRKGTFRMDLYVNGTFMDRYSYYNGSTAHELTSTVNRPVITVKT